MVASAAVEYRLSSGTRKRAVCLGITIVVLLLLVGAGWFYRAHVLAGLDIIGEATGGRTTAALSVAGGLLVLVWLLVWILFPIIVYLGMRDLRRRTAELDQTTRLCVRHLAQLTAAREAKQLGADPREKGPGAGPA